jgi:hypothetical protein
MIPPIEVPCPPMNLVAEWTTTSAPHARGWHRYGDVTVLSIKSGTLFACATSATPSKSSTSFLGLPTLSA